jgi:pimeloyl-ACP methyl ester carboxylesterase
MLGDFLPSIVQSLSEPSSIQLAQRIQRKALKTSLQADPLSIAYTCQGESNPPIVLLHGFDSSQLEFRFLCPQLAPCQQTWTIDLLGFGFSLSPTQVSVNPLSIRTALYRFWEVAISRPMLLVGASMGGAVAIDFTLTYPNIVEKLVLIDSTGYTNTPAFVQFLVPPLDRLGVAYLRWRKLLAIQLSQLSDADASWLDLLHCATLHQEMPGWQKSMLEFNKSGGYNFLPGRIAEINQPTLILWGEQDQVLGIEDARKFAETILNSQLVWIANSGHAPHIEQPQVTAQQILSFSAV